MSLNNSTLIKNTPEHTTALRGAESLIPGLHTGLTAIVGMRREAVALPKHVDGLWSRHGTRGVVLHVDVQLYP